MSVEAEQAAQHVTLGEAVSILIRNTRQKRLQDEIDKRGQSQPKNPYLSQIGECDREIVYTVTHWKDRPAIDTDLKARFEAGEEQERIITRELNLLGFPVKFAQERIEIFGQVKEQKVLLATGKIDGAVTYGGVDIPIEIKSMDPNIFRRIRDGKEGALDFKQKPHLRRYLRQLQMYLHGQEKSEGLFIITDCLGHIKIIPVEWDAGECEQILQRLERVYPHWNLQTLPSRIEYQDELCGRCYFAGICLPDIVRPEAEVVIDPEWLSKIKEYHGLKEVVKRYEELKDDIKGRFDKVKQALAGDYIIMGRQQTKKECVVKESTFWVTTVKRLDELKGKKGEVNT